MPSHAHRENIPYNLTRRICPIVDEKDTTDKRLLNLKEKIQQQKYPNTLIDHGIQKAKIIPRPELRKAKSKDNNENKILSFVTTHNPNNPNLFPIIRNTLLLLSASEKMKTSLKNVKLIKSKRTAKNLKRMLTKA